MKAFLPCAVFLLGVLIIPSSFGRIRRDPSLLNPNDAEEILGLIQFKPRFLNEEWLEIVGVHKGEKYTVKKGDTLWDISQRVLGRNRVWPKIWEVNSFLTNPHLIEPGQILTYFLERDREPASITVPLVKLQKGGSSSLEKDTKVTLDIKNRYRPSLLVLNADDRIFGEISGSYTDRELLGEQDTLYLSVDGTDQVQVGDRFAVVHEERTLKDKSQSGNPVLGTIVRYVGEIVVTGLGEKLVRGELRRMYGPVKRKDKLIAPQRSIEWFNVFNPPDDLQAKILVGEDTDTTLFGQGQLVLINKGSSEGMKPGFLFRVFHDTDPVLKKTEVVEPSFKGEVQVIFVSRLSSVAYILRNSDPISVGDALLPIQLFEDPPPRPIRPTKNIEFD